MFPIEFPIVLKPKKNVTQTVPLAGVVLDSNFKQPPPDIGGFGGPAANAGSSCCVLQ